MKNRMKEKVLACVLASVMVLSMAGCANSGGDKSSGGDSKAQEELIPVSFRLNYAAQGLHVPFYYALEQGYYEEEGLDVTIGEGTGGGTTAKLVGAGEDDIGLVDAASVASAVDNGIPLKVVCPVYAVSGFAVVSLAEAGIEEPKDIEGKKVGVTTGDSPQNLFPAFAAANEIDESTINYVMMDSNAKVTSLLNGDVDCVLGGADDQAITLRNMGEEVNVLRYSDYGAAAVGLSIVASDDMIAKNPEVVQKFISASMKAWNECRENSDEQIEVFMKKFGTLDEEVVKGSLEVALDSLFAEDSETLGDVSETDWEACRNLLVEYLGLSSDMSAEELYTYDCLPDNLPAK